MERPIAAQAPVMIIGAHRSGTTATTRALKLLGLQIGHRLDSHDEPRAMQRLHEVYLRELGAAWHDPAPFLSLIGSAERKQSCVRYLRAAVEKDLSPFGYDHSLTSWWLKRRLRGGARWGWKEPRTTLFASCWLELFPDARILHVVRNPLAVARSMQKRELEFQAKGDAPSGQVQEFDYCVQLAMTYVEAGEAVAASAKHYLRVRFEDIQSDPAAELKRLGTYCGLEFSGGQLRRAAATIRPIRSDAAQQISDRRGLLAQYPTALKLGYGGDQGVIDD